MRRLYDGVVRFHKKSGGAKWKDLAKGQSPHTLFLTCADSRIVPASILQCGEGEVFVTRNVGNLVEPREDRRNSVAAVVEYAIAALRVESIVVCGHTDCGAMKAILHPEKLEALPSVAAWLQGADKAVARARKKYPGLADKKLATRVAEENVLLQVEQLRRFDVVKQAEAKGEIDLFAWMFHLETGKVHSYDSERGEFLPVEQGGVQRVPPPASTSRKRS